MFVFAILGTKIFCFAHWQNHCSDSSDDTDDGDDQEASSLQVGKHFEDALTSFREQWQRELTISPKHDASKTPKQPSVEVANDEASIESKVLHLLSQN